MEKGAGMLVVSLRGVNLGSWSRLGCSGQNAIICSLYVTVRVSFRVAKKKYKNIYLINMFLIWSLLGVKKV